MKTPVIVFSLVVAALSVVPAGNPCHAGTITYDFVEGIGSPNPGETGATITFLSPPAQPMAPWTINSPTDVIGIQIIDSAPVLGGFSGAISVSSIEVPIQSITGTTIDAGHIDDEFFLPHAVIITTQSTYFNTAGVENQVAGTWTVSASVPEPASAVPAGIAIASGLALAAFRRRKEARRQRPVGPLDANQ